MTTLTKQPATFDWRPAAARVARQAHWLAGLLFLAALLIWTRADIGGAWSSEFRKPLYLANVLMLYMLVAMGLNILSGYAGASSIGHIALFGIGAYTQAILVTEYEWGFWPAVLAGAVVATLASLPVGLILLRLSGWYFSVVTLLLVVVVNDIFIQQKDLTGGGAGIFGLFLPSLFGNELGLKEYLYLLIAINVAVFLMLRQLVDVSRWGRALVAVRDVEPAARAVGIQPFMVRESALALSAFVAGLAGALFPALPGLINPESFPIIDSIFFLLAVLAGGMGTVAGPVVGTVVLYSLPQILAEQEGLKKYSFLVYGVLLLLLVIFLPEGLVGGIRRLWYALLGRWGLDTTPAVEGTAVAGATSAPAGAALVGAASPTAGLSATTVEPPSPNGALTPPDQTASSPALRYMNHSDFDGDWAVEAEDISLRFGDVVALQDVTVRVRPATVHAIVGPNGSGKTTLINVLSGFYAQDSGRVRALGRAFPRGAAPRAIHFGMARTFQTQHVLPQLSVVENVMLGCHAWGRVTWLDGMLPLPNIWRERRRMRETALACLDLVGLGRGIAEQPCGRLPFAHQRLLEIARALAGRPQILLLDEPASGLHAEEVRVFARLIRQLRAAGLTIVLVEHNFGLVSELADTITVLDAGVKLAEGDYDSVRHDQRVVEAYLGA